MVRYALPIGGSMTWFIYIAMVVTFVVSYPIAWLITLMIGHEYDTVLSKNKMKRMFKMYEDEKLLHPHENRILSAALDFTEKKAEDVMTPLEKAFMLDIDSVITKDLLR